MIGRFALLVVWIACGLGLSDATAQFSALNRIEIQSGNIPYDTPRSLTTAFQQLNLRYDAGALRVSARAEQFQTSKDDRRYVALSQARLSLQKSGFSGSVGNFYEIIGRGLLLRGFEIPGATYEDASFRVRQSFQRDIQGATAGYSNGRFGLRALRGKPLVTVLPPTVEGDDRRPDLVSAAVGHVRIGNGRFEGSYLRNETDNGATDFTSLAAEWTAFGSLTTYVEVAQRVSQGQAMFDLSDTGRHALYGAITYGRPGFGASLEYKRYKDFFLGSGFNDPPSLVREHAWIVLNRSTHVLFALDERGYQVEVYGTVPGGTATVNATRAVNALGIDLVYTEYYAEYATKFGSPISGRFFVDVAEDPLKGEAKRRSAGAYIDRGLPGGWSVSATLEGQTFKRTFLDNARAVNAVLGVTLSRSSRFSGGVVAERSTDPFFTDDPRTAEIESTARYWLGVSLGYRPNRRHTLGLFFGTRRGGPACTSGICYEVLDFEGAELRITSRL